MISKLRRVSAERDRGFTLIELLVVIIIIGILAAIAIPVFLNQRTKGYESAVESDLRNLAIAQEAVNTEYGVYITSGTAASVTSLTSNGYVASDNVVITLATNASGYCATGHNSNGGRTFYVSPASGGVNATGC